MARVTVKVRFGPRPTRLIAAVGGRGLAHTNAAASWIRIFVAFLRDRYAKFSRGLGDWPPLKAATIRRRRRRSSAILRNTGLMFAQFHPELQSFQHFRGSRPFSATMAFGGNAFYPDSGASVTDVMSFHQRGEGNLPVRKLIVPPDEPTKALMARATKKAIKDDVG